VDINPIGDLLKSEVREIARELNLDRSIIDAAPTDGLFGDMRTDEAQIGATYDELEWAMQQQENKNQTEQMNERQKKVMEIYLQRHQANQHKMKKIPVCIIPKELKQSKQK
jgi:NAD+ synthase